MSVICRKTLSVMVRFNNINYYGNISTTTTTKIDPKAGWVAHQNTRNNTQITTILCNTVNDQGPFKVAMHHCLLRQNVYVFSSYWNYVF